MFSFWVNEKVSPQLLDGFLLQERAGMGTMALIPRGVVAKSAISLESPCSLSRLESICNAHATLRRQVQRTSPMCTPFSMLWARFSP
eukprot:1137164-Pelagomonas_calceolata.AAC.3